MYEQQETIIFESEREQFEVMNRQTPYPMQPEQINEYWSSNDLQYGGDDPATVNEQPAATFDPSIWIQSHFYQTVGAVTT